MSDLQNILNLSASGMQAQASRLRHVSENIANADTPGYHAKDIKPFKEVYAAGPRPGDMVASRGSHLNGINGSNMDWAVTTSADGSDPNDNSVSIETEILHGVEVKRQHDRALAIYKSSMNILRSSLGRG